jgi:hypothetical protein
MDEKPNRRGKRMSVRVMTTSKYDLFEPNPINRIHKEGTEKYSVLEGLLLKHGWIETRPMIVGPKKNNGKHTIMVGHNRFRIAVKHGLPVKFQIEEKIQDIYVFEGPGGQPTWSLADWVHSRARQNENPAYRMLLEFQERTKITTTDCICLFATGSSMSNSANEIRNGTFMIENSNHAEAVGSLVMYCASLDIPYSTKSAFVRVLSQIVKTKVVDTEELAKRIRRNIGIMKRKYFVPNYLGILTEVYNYRSSPKIDLATEVRNALDAERAAHVAKAGRASGVKRRAA